MAASPRFHPHQLAVCGYSGSGKTTLLVRLIEALSPGYRIGYVKHDAHRFRMDRPGKDTWRAAEAGAADVLINDARRTARIAAGEPGPFDAFAMLDCDWVLIEGYKNSDVPKILVLDAGGRAEAEYRADRFRNVLACVGPGPAPDDLPGRYFHRDDVPGVTTLVRSFWRDRLARVPLYGLVLAGAAGEPRALALHELARRHCERAWLSTRGDRVAEAALAGAPALVERMPEPGPLGAILTAMQAHPEAAWLVLACDRPEIDDRTVGRLLAGRDPFRFATSCRRPQDGLPEPLCAVYEPKSRLRLFQAAALGHGCPGTMLMHARIALLDGGQPGEPRT